MSLLHSLIGRYTHRRDRSGPDGSTPIAASASEPSTPPAPAPSADAPSEPSADGPSPEHPAMRRDPLMLFPAEGEPGRSGRKPHFIFVDAPTAATAAPATPTPTSVPAPWVDGVLGQLQQAAEGVRTAHARVDEVVAMVANVSVDRQQIDAIAREAQATAEAAFGGLQAFSNRVAALEGSGTFARQADERPSAVDALAEKVGAHAAALDRLEAKFESQAAALGEQASAIDRVRGDGDALTREAHAALAGLQELSNRVAALEGADTLARQADERLSAVNALAEKISTHAAVLDRLEAAIGWQTATLREQVSAIDRVRGDAEEITRLAQGADAKLAAVDAREKSTASAADMLARLERAVEDCNALLGNVDTVRRDLSDQMNRLDELMRASASARQVVATSAAPRPESGAFRTPPGPAWSAVASTWVNRFAQLRIPRPVLVATSVTAALIAFTVWQLISLTYPSPVAVQQFRAPETRVSAPETRVTAPEVPGSASTQAGSATIGEPSGTAARNPLASPRAVKASDSVIAQTAGQPTVARDLPRTARPISAPLFIGNLSIDSNPSGATVLIDHRPAGQTPLSVSRLRAGSHVVAVEHGGYQRWTSAVSVVADTTTRVNARLQADPLR